jgi:hypothetical protein
MINKIVIPLAEQPTAKAAAIINDQRSIPIVAFLAAALGFELFSWVAVKISGLMPDSVMYLGMITNGIRSVPQPFCFRPLVPLLAKALPLSLPHAFFLITHLALTGTILMLLMTAWRMGLSCISCIFGTLVVFCSPAFLYCYHNPVLTDAPGIFVIAVMFYAQLTERPFLFGAFGIPGILVRENICFLFPALLVGRKWRRGIVFCAIGLVVYAVPRIIFFRGAVPVLGNHLFSFGGTSPRNALTGAVYSWFSA